MGWKMKKEVDVNSLIERFKSMRDRGSLLTGDISQEDLFLQIVGTICREAMIEEDE